MALAAPTVELVVLEAMSLGREVRVRRLADLCHGPAGKERQLAGPLL